MRIVLFGGSGMVGQAALRECLLDPGVEAVTSVVRRPTGQRHEKLNEIVHGDFQDFTALEPALAGHDACFFCLGVSSAGMAEGEYRKVTRDIALAAAATLLRVSPEMTFVFVSGAGADSTEHGRVMWARVKGEAENALLHLPFRGVYVFRPAYIQALDGIRSRTPLYNVLIPVLRPLYPMLSRLLPRYTLTTRELGRAMLEVARNGAPLHLLESADIKHVLPRPG
jgi:uncharacterized protein YbjT (DUF2867 family)